VSGRGAFAALVASVALLAGCGGNGDGANDANGDGDLGREVFTSIAEPTCGSCHTLAAAGTDGSVGPNLDEVKPSADQVESAVRAGLGIMPSFEGQLGDEEIVAVSNYVADASG
jgi:cytochrome c6